MFIPSDLPFVNIVAFDMSDPLFDYGKPLIDIAQNQGDPYERL